ncbi:interferon alpha-inducible protein 27-like protein 2A [Anomalospiza imberbis]|uniref:interferon alpha-inducible protein 27-like protein 2A n=1 Tax=Anomalospiza imberbis TaxID=187417 RepID=UPI00358FC21C
MWGKSQDLLGLWRQGEPPHQWPLPRGPQGPKADEGRGRLEELLLALGPCSAWHRVLSTAQGSSAVRAHVLPALLPFSFSGKNRNVIGTVIGATVGAGLALVGLPVCIGALGFTGAGIAAGSIAAKMMSAAAIANGGGVAAGSAVAVLQSIGAAGLSLGAKVGLTAALGSAGAASGDLLSE